MANLILQKTHALGAFKKSIGRTNFDLITLLVGAQGVRSHQVSKSPDFHVTWQPSSMVDAGNLAGQFARKATLAWIVDALDAYLSALQRFQRLNSPDSNLAVLKKQWISLKLKAAQDDFQLPDDQFLTLVKVAIHWRNRHVHSWSGRKLAGAVIGNLRKHRVEYDKEFHHLDVDRLEQHLSKNDVPRFKEISGIIQASVHFVTDLDRMVIPKLDPNKYAEYVLHSYFKEPNRLEEVWGLSAEKRLKKIQTLFLVSGFTVESPTTSGPILAQSSIIGLSDITLEEARKRYRTIEVEYEDAAE